MSGDAELLIEGLRRLRRGASLQIISYVLIVLLFVVMLFSIYVRLFFNLPPNVHPPSVITDFFSLITMLFVGFIISELLIVLGYYFWFSATSYLKRYDSSRLGVGRVGAVLATVGFVLIVLSLCVMYIYLMFISSPSAWEQSWAPFGMPPNIAPMFMYMMSMFGLFFGSMVIGVILAFIGSILFSIMLIRLGEVEGVSKSLNTAGILLLVGIILLAVPGVNVVAGVLLIVAIILIYTGCGESIARLKRGIL